MATTSNLQIMLQYTDRHGSIDDAKGTNYFWNII